MTKRTVILGSDSEWVEDYHSCGRVMSFTADKAKAKRFAWWTQAGREQAVEAITAARNLYRRGDYYGQDV